MVKQRNLFDPNRIDILVDEKDKPFEDGAKAIGRLIVQANNSGLKVGSPPRSKRKGYQDLPLFKKEQKDLFNQNPKTDE